MLPPRPLPKNNVIHLMPSFKDDALRDRAWCVATFDAESGKLLRAGIYSSPARGITRFIGRETLLEGPVGVGRTYEEARREVVKALKGDPSYRWLWRAVRDYEAKSSGLKAGDSIGARR